MSRFSRLKPSQPSDPGSYIYNPVGFDSRERDQEMQNMNTSGPRVFDPDAPSTRPHSPAHLEPADLTGSDFASIRSATVPLLEPRDLGYPDSASDRSGTDRPPMATNQAESTDRVHKGVSVENEASFLKRSEYLHGWRMGITLCVTTAVTVFMINLILTIWGLSRYGLKDGGIGTIQEGSCKTARRLSLWLHLIINVLSTLLLGASNYTMQCLASPTREEVDRAHSQNRWLDIGVPSIRNLTRIPLHRKVLWWFLVFSGVPLHLLYNSVVFSTISFQMYSVYVASPDLVGPKALNLSGTVITWGNEVLSSEYLRNISSWQQLDNAACIRAYAQPYVSAYGDIVAISSFVNGSALIEIGDSEETGSDSYDWLCSSSINPAYSLQPCDVDHTLKNALSWTLSDNSNSHFWPIQYCLSQPVSERCQVHFSIIIVGVVMACNFLKALCMLLALRCQSSRPLVTLRDAIQEFLVKPDRTTRLACLSGKESFIRRQWRDAPSKWERKGHRWFSNLSMQRWLVCNVLCAVVLIVAGALLGIGLDNGGLTDRSLSHLWQMGYGAVTGDSMLDWDLEGSSGLHLNALVANLPQVVLSFLFLLYNGLFTSMLLADEWNGYARERKPLRVTDPKGSQRSTYRLQLPYKYGVPLLAVSATLHWLVSQSLFLVNMRGYMSKGQVLKLTISTLGYSCIAIITVILLGAVILLLELLHGFKVHRGMPLAGSCSAAISAACHRPEEDVDAATKPVMWGVVSSKNGVGHCCFTSFEVSQPVPGELYF